MVVVTIFTNIEGKANAGNKIQDIHPPLKFELLYSIAVILTVPKFGAIY